MNRLGINNDAIAIANSLSDNLIKGLQVDGGGFAADSLGASTIILRLYDDFIICMCDGHENSFSRGRVCAGNSGDGLKSRGKDALGVPPLSVEDDDERVILPLRDLAYHKSERFPAMRFRWLTVSSRVRRSTHSSECAQRVECLCQEKRADKTESHLYRSSDGRVSTGEEKKTHKPKPPPSV